MKRLPERRALPLGAVAAFYGIMSVVAIGLAVLWRGEPPFRWPGATPWSIPGQIAAGCGAGLLVVAFSRWLERFGWARRLSDALAGLVGPLSPPRALALAAFSGVGEELLFRGLLMPWLGLVPTSLVFGLMHVGPGREFIPWTIMAIGAGCLLGALMIVTGGIIAPIVAHVLINALNLLALRDR